MSVSVNHRIIWPVVEIHLEEAGFLWTQWECHLLAPNVTLPLIRPCEARLSAHIEGLVVGGSVVAKRVLQPALFEADDPELVFAAALAFLSSRKPACLNDVWTAFVESEDEDKRGAIERAMQLSELDELVPRLLETHRFEEAGVKAAALRVLGFQGVHLDASALAQFLEDQTDEVQGAALRTVRVPQNDPKVQTIIEQSCSHQSPVLRDAALEVGLVLGFPRAWESCKHLVKTRQPNCRLALLALAMLGGSDEHDIIKSMVEDRRCRDDVLWAMGYSGTVEMADLLLDLMGDESAARLAGEAFTAITGLDLEAEKFCIEPRPDDTDEPIPFENDDLDADLDLKPEDLLLLPDPARVAGWWATHRPYFHSQGRYLQGQPFDLTMLCRELETGVMRRRHGHALELAIRTRGECRVQTRAFSNVQHVQLQQIASSPMMRSGG